MAKAKLTRGKLVRAPTRAKVSPGAIVRRPGATSTPALGGIAPITPPASAPVAVPPPTSQPATPLPPDAGYEATIAGLASQRDSKIAGLGQQRQQGLLQYGYTEAPGGALGFDPTNPFSQAAVLKRNYDQARTGNTTNYAARGQLYAGSLQTAQDETNRGESQASDTLQKQLGAFLARNTQARFTAGSDYDLGVGQALGDAINRAPSNPAYTPVTDATQAATAAAPGATAAKAYRSVAGKDSKNRPGVWHYYPDGRKVFVRK